MPETETDEYFSTNNIVPLKAIRDVSVVVRPGERPERDADMKADVNLYRFFIEIFPKSRSIKTFKIFYPMIYQMKVCNNQDKIILYIQTFLFQTFRIYLPFVKNYYTATDSASAEKSDDSSCMTFLVDLFEYAKVDILETDVYAFTYFKERQFNSLSSGSSAGLSSQGWTLHTIMEEYQRQGVLKETFEAHKNEILRDLGKKDSELLKEHVQEKEGTYVVEMDVMHQVNDGLTPKNKKTILHESESNDIFTGKESTRSWRLSLMNEDYSEIPSYPSKLLVPLKISDSALHYACKHRSKGRIPVLSYYHQTNGAVLLRSSQPLTGLSMKRSFQDEKLLQELFNSSAINGDNVTESTSYIVDARSVTSAMANHATGAGTENLDHYRNCRRLYLGIDNIHGVRDTYLRLLESYPSLDFSSFDSYSILPYEFQGWYKHLSVLLDSTFKVVRLLDLGHSVLIHCSDGWDRTTQILTLAAILLDPYYRTIQGLIVLIEKEWISFGHRFADRSGLYSNVLVPKLDSIMYCEQFSYSKKNIREFSPIFPQFLEVLYQFLRIWPTSFQYNEQMLRFLLEHYYSGKYGNFLFNSEQEAVLVKEDFKESARVYQTNNNSISCPILAADNSNRSNSTDCIPTNDDFVVIHSPPSLSSSAKVLLSVAASASLDPNIGNRRCDFTVHIYEAIIENFCTYCNLSYEVDSEERVLLIEQVPEPMLWKELYCGEIICDTPGNNQGKSIVENIRKEATLPDPKLDNTNNTVSGPSLSGKIFTTASPTNTPQISSQFRTAPKPVIVKDHPMPRRQLPNATFSLLTLSTSLENEFYLQKNT